MTSSAEFVEALGRLGFPDASSLKPTDFDWVFDSSPEGHEFIHSICRTLDKSNVITAEEARAFQELKDSGKPILDEAALSKVLTTTAPSEEGSEVDPDPLNTSSSASDSEDDLTIEELEEELQLLLKEKALKERRCNKLQAFALAGEEFEQQFAAGMESAESKMNEAIASTEVANIDTDTMLKNLTDKLRQLGSHVAKEGELEQDEEGEPVAQAAASAPKRPPTLLSQLSLDPFLQLDEDNTKNLALLLQSPLVPDVSEIFEASSSEHSNVDLSAHADETEENEETKNEEKLLNFKRTEMARIQWSYIVAQHQLIQATAEEKGLMAGIKWFSELSPTEILSESSLQDVTEDELVEELQIAEVKLEEMLNKEGIPALLRKSARALRMPVVSGDLDIQLANYEDYISIQSEVIDYLLHHRASLKLILVALKKELKMWKSCHSDLEELRNKVVKDNEEVSVRMESLEDLDRELEPNTVLTSKEASFSRLLQLLENGSSPDLPTVSDLDEAAEALENNLKLNQTALENLCREQQCAAARLAEHRDKLHQVLYTELQYLFLGQQAHPAATDDKKFVLPNAQELTAQLFDVETRLKDLQQVLQEILGEIKAKRSELEQKPHLVKERQLYVHFNLDPEKMEKIIQDAESKATKKA